MSAAGRTAGAVPAAATAAVGPDTALASPDALWAETTTESAWPTSAAFGTYFSFVAPGICWQFAPAASQLCHW